MTEPTRQQLLDAAARVYAEAGFRGATTRRIADEAGVNEVTLFRLFGSKAALIKEAIIGRFRPDLAAALPEVPKDPQAELTAWAESDHHFLCECRGMIRTTMAEIHTDPDNGKRVAENPVENFQVLHAYVERLAKHRFIPSAKDAAPASAMLMGTLFADAMGRDFMPEMFPPVDKAPATYVRLFLRALGATVVALLLVAFPSPAIAQQAAPASLSLAEALRLAESKSEGVTIAGAGVERARGQQRQANSQRLPQLNGSAGYQRAIQSQFEEITKRFPPDTTGGGGGGGLESSPLAQIFAAPNTFTLTLAFQQNLYTAGRIGAARAGAAAGLSAAEIAHRAAKAQAALDAAQAYFDAVASDRFLAIAESSLVLTERTLAATQLGREVGSVSEFDLLRARVTRDNQRPAVIQARGARSTAYLRLKQLLDLPLAAPLTLTTDIRDDSAAVDLTAPITLADDRRVVPDTTVDGRAARGQAPAPSARHSAPRARPASRRSNSPRCTSASPTRRRAPSSRRRSTSTSRTGT
jgi:AcrR family transcriptional regulator